VVSFHRKALHLPNIAPLARFQGSPRGLLGTLFLHDYQPLGICLFGFPIQRLRLR
jgi:hypothetical protein